MVKKLITSVTAAAGTLAAFASPVFAQGIPPQDTISIDAGQAGFKITDIGILITRLLQVVLGIVGLLVFIYLIWGGIEWLTAGGDKSKTESARQKITNAIIGLAIVASAFAIGAVLNRFFGTTIGGPIAIPQGY
jgi:hypothetical protein